MAERTLDIWKDFNQPLRAYISRRVANDGDADDILQEVFVKIHTRIHTLRDEERLPSWLYRIAKNAVTDHYRNRQLLINSLEPLDIEDRSVELDASTKLAERMPIMVLRCLPEKYAQALWLADLEGLTQKELAQRLGLSLSGAKTRVQRARRLLRAALMKCCHFEFDSRGRVIDYFPRACCSGARDEEAETRVSDCS